MTISDYRPLFELTRGEIVESIHFGAIAVADPQGRLLAHYGNPESTAFLRSTAKPFQALPFVESGGMEAFNLTQAELALICASHSGTDEQVAGVRALQAKVGFTEADLLCGAHPPSHEPTLEAMRQRGEQPTPIRNNCSGKHTAMLAFARLQNWPTADYISPSHRLQAVILKTFAEMCDLPLEQVRLGIDGCSAPNFAVPLRRAAMAYARLYDPNRLPEKRTAACRAIVAAMTGYPEMVGGPGRFDTRIMQVTRGRILSKGGAEGYQGMGLPPGALSPASPAVGIALKVSDGDLKGRARPAVSLEILRQLGALSPAELEVLSDLGPTLPLKNFRNLVIGETRPSFQLMVES